MPGGSVFAEEVVGVEVREIPNSLLPETCLRGMGVGHARNLQPPAMIRVML